MATLLLSVGGQALGAAIGGPVGATIGRALGALAGSAIDNRLFGEDQPDHQGGVRLLGSREGAPISRLYGWSRLSGNIIWATELERRTTASSGAKSMSTQEDDSKIIANLAVGFCEGEVAHLGRIWADGQLLDTRNLTYRFHKGSADQSHDSLIAALQGTENCPAYRGLCYIVFENLDLSQFGNRIPQISAELCRPVGDLERNLKAVCVIPGSTEFGYDPAPRVWLMGYGETQTENAHHIVGRSNWDVSIDELTSLCPNLKHVALVVSWFGDDLRCSTCEVAPRVIDHERQIKDVEWRVAGLTRSAAQIASDNGDGPAYGGTPSDQSIIDAIKDLNSRGINVTLYPLMMMDVPANNALPNPYDSAQNQPPYPWRGRVTIDPAIGQPGSVDKTAAASSQVAQFMGACQPSDFGVNGEQMLYSGPNEWRYRRFILHYANLARAAGGVDAMIIGSEMPGLSFARESQSSFPFVSALQDLVVDVRQIVGASCKLTYAADWSEYHGYQPSDEPGGKYFHLDPLWAHPQIDAVGIDNYMPLGDWRPSAEHADKNIAAHEKDLDYLAGNIYAGEGYDWYYASAEARSQQDRTPIADGAAGEAWVWRFKDFKSWWENAHHDRPNGVKDATASAWVPQSKPLWLTELGCGAVDLAANQPNAFSDPKSVEHKSPYFSDGSPDPAMQRQFVRAHFEFWRENGAHYAATNNPISTIYGGSMLDPDRVYLWAWDARPFPAFPLLRDEWSDGAAYFTGHWLNGRLGGATIDEMAVAIAKEAGIDLATTASSSLFIEGQVTAGAATVRAELAGLLASEDLFIDDVGGQLTLTNSRWHIPHQISYDQLAVIDNEIVNIKYPDAEDQVRRLDLKYAERLADYAGATAFYDSARESGDRASLNWPTTLDPTTAGHIAAAQWRNGQDAKVSYRFDLPPSLAAYHIGDVLAVEQTTLAATIDAMQTGHTQRVSLTVPADIDGHGGTSETTRTGRALEPAQSAPMIVLAQVPNADASELTTKMLAAAYAKPWPGTIRLTDSGGQGLAEIDNPNAVGILQEDVPIAHQIAMWAHDQSLLVRMLEGHLSSASASAVLQGLNRLWVECADGTWEQIGFANATLVAPKTYRLTQLLRGLGKTQFAARQASVAGGRVLVVWDTKALDMNSELVGANLELYAYAGAASPEAISLSFTPQLEALLPLAPVHVSAKRDPLTQDINIQWVRCTRIGGDMWQGADVPLDTDNLQFNLRIGVGPTVARVTQVSQSNFTYTSAAQIGDFGALADGIWIEIDQHSAIWGAGHGKRIEFSD
ncbi:baseplate multidomain protein megatron [Maritalea myrionectae]|uniref:baseplate multidomain protein megatron n=1 Tax=Maritalea myrionectae TaxID=454601 RepID=UPI000408FD35|nr:glycoside hydrolase TIM-barrel-like domain-containing protein [Maritalea myrionectae]